MSEPPLASVAGRYQLYKEGTHRICSWLARTASASTSNVKAKLDRTFSTERAPNDSVFQTKVRDLLTFANTIANSASTEFVPPSIIDLLTEVIAARRSCAKFYANQNMGAELAASYAGHIFFVEVLEQVQNTLAPLQPPSPGPQGSSTTQAGGKKAKKEAVGVETKLVNIFAALEIEEPSSSPLGNNGPSRDPGKKATARTLNLNQDSKMETSFKVYCFLEDVHEVRCTIKKAWEDFRAGGLSFLAASLVLETGMALLRVSNAELLKSCPEFADWSSLPDFFALEAVEVRDVVYLFPRQSCNKGAEHGTESSIIDRIHPAAAHKLRELRKHVVATHEKARDAPGSLEDKLQNAIESSGYPISCAGILNDDCFAFSDVMDQLACDFAMITFARSRHDPEDFFSEFEQGIENFIWTGQLPIWLVAAYHVYCDISEIIGSAPTLTGDICLSKLAEMDAKVKEHRAFARDHDFVPLESNHPGEPLRQIGVYKNDYEIFCKPDNDTKLFRPSTRRLPCRAGCTIFKALQFFHECGIMETVNLFTLSALAHLYSAGRALGLIQNTWVDMEFVLSRQNSIRRLITLPNDQRDPSAWARCFLIALGVPLREIAGNDRPNIWRAKNLAEKARKLAVSSALIRALKCQNDSDDALEFLRGNLLDVVLRTLAQRGTANKKPGNTHANKNFEFTPQRLLATFRELIVSDEPALNFDYSNFTASCVLIQEKIYDEIAGDPRGKMALPQVVYELLNNCTRDATFDPKATKGHRKYTPLHCACETIDDYIKTRGNKFSQEAFQQSSGHIPRSLRPQLVSDDDADYGDFVVDWLEEHYEDLVVRVTPSHTTVYDPNGAKERFERAEEKCDEMMDEDWRAFEEAAKENGIDLSALLGDDDDDESEDEDTDSEDEVTDS